MGKAIVIIGLPGSGKTTFANALGGRLVDDATQNEDELYDALASDEELVVITDVNAIYSRREQIISLIASKVKRKVEIICYENDPEACWANVCARGDGRVSRSGLLRMANAYKLDAFDPDMVLPVYKP